MYSSNVNILQLILVFLIQNGESKPPRNEIQIMISRHPKVMESQKISHPLNRLDIEAILRNATRHHGASEIHGSGSIPIYFPIQHEEEDEDEDDDSDESNLPSDFDVNELTSSLLGLAVNVSGLLNQITNNWISDGEKIIHNKEVNLRRIQNEMCNKVEKLIIHNSKYGHVITQCIDKASLQTQLDLIFHRTMACYSNLLHTVQSNLLKIEERGKHVIAHLQLYSRDMVKKLEACFQNTDVLTVLNCMKGIEMRSTVKDYGEAYVLNEIIGLINYLPAGFRNCTSAGVSETEKQIKKMYALTLKCFSKQPQ